MSDAIADRNAARPGAPTFELFLVFIALGIVLIAQFMMSGAWRLISHPLWLDECFTQLIANDPSFSHSMSAVSIGVDQSPPTLYLFLRPIYWMIGPLNPTALRLFAATMMTAGAVGFYAYCRCFFDRAAAWVGALALVSHPAVVDQMFEARGYTTWLAVAAWLCYFLAIIDSRERLKQRAVSAIIGAGAMAVIIVTIHWFGVISFALIALTDFLLHRDRLARRMIPVVFAAVALAICLPILLRQRAALVERTWLAPVTIAQIWLEMSHLFNLLPLTVVVICYFIWRIGAGRAREPGLDSTRDCPRFAPLAALLLMPVATIALSYIYEPVFLWRYVFVASLPLAFVSAWLASRMRNAAGRSVRRIIAILLIALGARSLQQRVHTTDSADALVLSARDDVQSAIKYHAPLPAAYLRLYEFMPVLSIDPNLRAASAMCYIDAASGLSSTVRFNQELAARINRLYPQYQLVHDVDLRAMNDFLVVAPTELKDTVQREFPNADVNLRWPDLFELHVR